MLDDEDEPALVIIPLSTRIENENTFVEIEIDRLEDQDFWTLEVVDELGGSTVWEDEFHSDEVALKAVLSVIEQDGLESFMLEEDEQDRPSIH